MLDFRILLFIISGVVGSGIFFTPYDLQFFGPNAFISFICMCFICSSIGFFFSRINTLSIFEFIEKYLGQNVGFFTAWLYWIISWSCTIITIGEMFRYFAQIVPIVKNYEIITKCSFVSIIILINCFKNSFAKTIEISVNVLKILLLLIFPVFCFCNSGFTLENLKGSYELKSILSGFPQTIWCFAGIECGAIVNKKGKIGPTIITGICFVGLIYFINLIGIFGLAGYKISSYTPYSDLMEHTFGNVGRLIFAFIVFAVTLGALNVWVISNGAVAVDNSKLKYFPKSLQKMNRYGAHYLAILISSIGLIPLCIFESCEVLKNGVMMASNGLLLFYIIFCLSYFIYKKSIWSLFCFFICSILFVYASSMTNVLAILLAMLLGFPFFILFKQNKNRLK